MFIWNAWTYHGVCRVKALADRPSTTLAQNCIMDAENNWQNNFSSAIVLFSITRMYSKSGASARACLWANGQSQSLVSILWLLIQVCKIMSECWEAEGVRSGVWCVHAVWAPGCPEVVREAGESSRQSGTSHAARRLIEWLFNGFSFHYKLMNAALRSET